MNKEWKTNTYRYSDNVRVIDLTSSYSSTRVSAQIYCSLFEVIRGDWSRIYNEVKTRNIRMSYLLPACMHPSHGWILTTEDSPRKISRSAYFAELHKLFPKWRDFTIQLLYCRGRGGRKMCIKELPNQLFHLFSFPLAYTEIMALFQWPAKQFLDAIYVSGMTFKWFVIHLHERCYRDMKSLSSLWKRITALQIVWIKTKAQKTACWYLIVLPQ